MSASLYSVWYALAAQPGPLPGATRDALIRYALPGGWHSPTETTYRYALQKALIGRMDVPRDAAAAIAGWPQGGSSLVADYLTRPDHPDDELADMLAGRPDKVLCDVAQNTTSPAALRILTAHRATLVVHAVATNKATPDDALVDVLIRLVRRKAGAVHERLKDCPQQVAEAVACRIGDIACLTTLVDHHDLPDAVHQRLAKKVITAVDAGANLDPGHLHAQAIIAVANNATEPVRRALAGALTTLDVRIDGHTPAEVLTPAHAPVRPIRGTPLTARSWPSIQSRVRDDPQLAAALADVLAEHLGAHTDAWDVFARHASGYTGPLRDLLTVAAGVAAPAGR